MAYATLAEFRAYLRANTTTPLPSGDDDQLIATLERAARLLDRWSDRTFSADTQTTRYFDARSNVTGTLLMFDCNYAASVSAVVNGDGVAVDPGDYVTEPRARGPFYGITMKAGASNWWTWNDSPENAIAVTGYWCYSSNTDGTPDADAVHMNIRLASWLYRQQSNSFDSDRPLMSAAGTVIAPAGLPHDVTAWLDAVKRLI